MADTTPSVKKYYDYAQQQVDEQALLDKFNAATTAQFNLQREQNRQAENQFYNQMYNTQQTAMDTIRQSNAAAVSTGASRGVQAAQELSALLGLQQESVASATELANANRQTAQEETAAVLENVLNAYQQAEQQRQNILSSAIQAESVAVEQESNKIATDASNLNTLWTAYLQAQANGDSAAAAKIWGDIQKINPNIGNAPATPPNPNVQAIANYGINVTEQDLKDMGYDPTKTFDENTIKKIVVQKGGTIPVTESGIQWDGKLAFSQADLNNKNVANIKKALESAGHTGIKSKVFNINNQEEYGAIKQQDVSTSKFEGEAGRYITKIKEDAAAGKIPVGAYIEMNYGRGDDRLTYVYLGNGYFIERNALTKTKPVNSNDLVITEQAHLYVPEGYKVFEDWLTDTFKVYVKKA